jgi:hypothetical protein
MLPATQKVKVTNLLNRNDGDFQNYKVEWLSVPGADGYKVYASVIPYGSFSSVAVAVGDVGAATTTYTDTSQTIVANGSDTINTYGSFITNVTHFKPFYSVRAYMVDAEEEKVEGDPSKWVSEEDSRWSCDGPFTNPYMIGTMPMAQCSMKYGLPSNKYASDVLGIIRDQAIWQLQQDGQWIWWFKRKVYGSACSHVDVDTNMCSRGDKCTECYGTNISGGFYTPIMIKAVIIYGSRKDVFENWGIRTVRESKSWTIWQPKLSTRDFFVLADGRRYEVTSVTPSSPYRGGIYNKQDFEFRELELQHVLYSVSVPGPLARN